jgi:tetratricopeptide (TPR) repeat protein
MDCRKTLVLVLALVSGSVGCSSMPSAPTNSAHAAAQQDKPKRQPKPATCVALARLREREAEEAQRTQPDRDRCRDEARQEYQQALQIDPNYLPALQGLAHFHDVCGDHERAVAAYEKALQLHPKEAGLWYELGMSRARKKEWEPAIKCLREALRLDPDSQQCATTLGFTLAQAGLDDESYECFRKQVGEARAHYNLARVLHHLQNDDVCRQHLALALQMPMDPELTAMAQRLQAELEGGESGLQPAAAVQQP